MNRRELIVNGTRLTAAAVLAALAGLLLGRRRSTDATCAPGPCSGCTTFNGCQLPRAEAARIEIDHGRP